MINWRLERIEDGEMIPGFAVLDDAASFGAGGVVAYVPEKYHNHGHLITAAPVMFRALTYVMKEHAKSHDDATDDPCQICEEGFHAIFKANGFSSEV